MQTYSLHTIDSEAYQVSHIRVLGLQLIARSRQLQTRATRHTHTHTQRERNPFTSPVTLHLGQSARKGTDPLLEAHDTCNYVEMGFSPSHTAPTVTELCFSYACRACRSLTMPSCSLICLCSPCFNLGGTAEKARRQVPRLGNGKRQTKKVERTKGQGCNFQEFPYALCSLPLQGTHHRSFCNFVRRSIMLAATRQASQ